MTNPGRRTFPAAIPTEIRTDAFREQRQLLDSVVSALDRIGGLRDQLRHRQDDIRDFLDANTLPIGTRAQLILEMLAK